MRKSGIDAIPIPSIDGRYSDVSFMLKMNPLLTLISNKRKGAGRPCDVETIKRAREAHYMLLAKGSYHAINLKPENKLRQVLEEMTNGDYPILEKVGSRGTVFLVRKPWDVVRREYAKRIPINNDEGYELSKIDGII